MSGRVRAGALAMAMLVGTAACGRSPTPRFYTLQSTAGADGGAALAQPVSVGPVTVPASVDRPQMVLQVSPNRVELQEFSRWASPLGDGIARVIAGDLATLLGSSQVASTPIPGFEPVWRVRLAVERFDAVPGDAVTVEAIWVVEQAGTGTRQAGRTVAREPLAGTATDGVAAAQSRALAAVSADVAAALRAASRTRATR